VEDVDPDVDEEDDLTVYLQSTLEEEQRKATLEEELTSHTGLQLSQEESAEIEFDPLAALVSDSDQADDERIFEEFDAMFSESQPAIADDLANPLSSQETESGEMAELDFAEFWESVKPLLDNSIVLDSIPSEALGSNVNTMLPLNSSGSSVAVDTTKWAENMQELLSGCLL